MNNKEVLNLKFTQEDISVNLELSDNFNTEHPIFEELAFYLGALEYNHQKDSPSIHLTTLEKLEILCKKAREYADEESSYSDSYNEVRVLVNNDKYSLDTPINLATSYDDIKLIDNNLLLQYFAKNFTQQSFQNLEIALFCVYFCQVRGLCRTLK